MEAGISSILDPVVRADPERAALVAPDRALSYAELDREADQAVGALRELGLRQGERIAVSLPNDSRIVVLFHAVMRLGAVWVGINRALTDAEQQVIIEDCDARVCVGCSGAGTGSTRLTVSAAGWAALLTGARPYRMREAVDPHAPAGIAYTSGTTGKPKGVVHSRHNLMLTGAVLAATRGYDHNLRKADCLPMTILNMLVLSTLLTSQAGGRRSSPTSAGRVPSLTGWWRPAPRHGTASRRCCTTWCATTRSVRTPSI